MEIIKLAPKHLHPDYGNRDAGVAVDACLVSLGTVYILEAEKENTGIMYAGLVAHTVLSVEFESEHHAVMAEAINGDELTADEEKTARNSCECLEVKYARLRNQSKLVDVCIAKRPTMLCTHCRTVQYCCVECQQGHGSSHREYCIRNRADRIYEDEKELENTLRRDQANKHYQTN